MTKQRLILALDIGTSSTRAIPYDVDTCEAVPGAAYAIDHLPDTTPDGGSTLDPDRIVAEAVTCLREATERAGADRSAADVLGVGISCFWHSFVGTDAQGKPQTPILLWSDRRSAPQTERLRALLGADAYTQRTGCQIHTSYPPGRLLWLREQEPDTWARCQRFLSPGEYLISRLFGLEKTTCAVSMASGTGLYYQAAGVWDEATLTYIPGLTASMLSPIKDEAVSGIRAPYRDRLAPLADIPWFPALGDGACSNIGCGATTPGSLALMIGTSGALRAPVTGAIPRVAPGCWRYQIDAGRYLVGGALSNGGAVWAWLKRTLHLQGQSDADLEKRLGEMPPDSHGLTVLPFLSGERAPLWRDDLTAAILGLHASTTPLEIARASLEAVAYRFATVRDALRAVVPEGRIIGTGAAVVASKVWTQMLADVLGEPIDVSEEAQASARGAALWARERLGLGSLESAPAVTVANHIVPNTDNGAIYAKARQRHEGALRLWLEEMSRSH